MISFDSAVFNVAVPLVNHQAPAFDVVKLMKDFSLSACAETCPVSHQRSAFLQKIGARVGCLGLATLVMRER